MGLGFIPICVRGALVCVRDLCNGNWKTSTTTEATTTYTSGMHVDMSRLEAHTEILVLNWWTWMCVANRLLKGIVRWQKNMDGVRGGIKNGIKISIKRHIKLNTLIMWNFIAVHRGYLLLFSSNNTTYTTCPFNHSHTNNNKLLPQITLNYLDVHSTDNPFFRRRFSVNSQPIFSATTCVLDYKHPCRNWVDKKCVAQ